MARGRFVSTKISESEQFADLENHEVRLMFLMMLPHADVEGRMKADTRYLSGKIFTYLGFDAVQIECALADMERAELLRTYSVKGRRYLFFPKFAEHQVGLRKDREQPSELPGPDEADKEETASQTHGGGNAAKAQSNSGVTPEKVPHKIKFKSKIKGEEEDKGSRRAREAPPEDPKAYSLVAYATSHYVAEWLRDARGFDFARAVAIWGDSLEDLWRAAVSAESRRPGDQARFRFQDACEGTFELGVRPKPEGQENAPPAERLPPGTPVRHPVWGEDVIRFYRQDGQLILDNCGATVPPGEVTPCPN